MTPLHLRLRLRATLSRVREMFRPIDESVDHGERPPMVWTDPAGKQWHVHPDDLQAWTPDHGQFDAYKRELRTALWRFANDQANAGMVRLPWVVEVAPVVPPPRRRRDRVVDRLLGRQLAEEAPTFTDPGPVWMPAVFPVSPDLAATCCRLGFQRLAEAAWPGLTEWTVRSFFDENKTALQAEAERRYAVNTATSADPTVWHPARGPMRFDSVEETIAMLSLGAWDGPTLPDGKVAAPLLPFAP